MAALSGAKSGRSPRGRRSLAAWPRALTSSGSISAWAEEPSEARATRLIVKVDLRVGGGA